jgi:uncharacterized protein YdaT
MFQLNNKPLALDTPFTFAEIQYPANWLRLASPEERAAIGITEVADDEGYDDRFYWGVGNPKQLEDRLEVKEDGTPLMVQRYDAEIESMVDTEEQVVYKGLKSQWVSQVKDTAGKLLAGTDWMIVRKYERKVAIPEAVATKRAAIVAEADRLEVEITACADVEALIAVVSTQNWGE